MADIPQEWVEKLVPVVQSRSLSLDDALAVLAAVLPLVEKPAVDREALVKMIVQHPLAGNVDHPTARAFADAILMSGLLQDAADVRRAVAEEIAAAIEDAGQTYWPGKAYRHAARIAREHASPDRTGDISERS